jgi:amino acid transporter
MLWFSLKVLRKGQWRLVDLSNGEELARKMLRLHEIRWRSSENLDGKQCDVQNLWGLL